MPRSLTDGAPSAQRRGNSFVTTQKVVQLSTDVHTGEVGAHLELVASFDYLCEERQLEYCCLLEFIYQVDRCRKLYRQSEL